MFKEMKCFTQENSDKYSLFAIIIFDVSHASLIEALRKQSYVDALDEVTGEEIAVFWSARPRGKVEFPRLPQGVIGHMVPMYRDAQENKKLYEFFDIESGQHLPLLVTFAFDDGGAMCFSKAKLRDDSQEGAYNYLKAILKEKSDLLRGFDDALKINKEKMFKELDLFDSYNNVSKTFGSFINIVSRLNSLNPF